MEGQTCHEAIHHQQQGSSWGLAPLSTDLARGLPLVLCVASTSTADSVAAVLTLSRYGMLRRTFVVVASSVLPATAAATAGVAAA